MARSQPNTYGLVEQGPTCDPKPKLSAKNLAKLRSCPCGISMDPLPARPLAPTARYSSFHGESQVLQVVSHTSQLTVLFNVARSGVCFAETLCLHAPTCCNYPAGRCTLTLSGNQVITSSSCAIATSLLVSTKTARPRSP